MSRPLLDVNVLLALLDFEHASHGAARRWFQEQRHGGWATCVHTQAGFVRISAQTSGGREAIAKSLEALRHMCASPLHEFWSEDFELSEIPELIRSRLQGHGQITDAVLLTLAIRRGGKLATFDRGICNLLPADSPHQAAIEVIPV